MVRVSGLEKNYRDGDRQIKVLSDLSLELRAGQSLALTGPSGSGKSTLLNVLAGLIPSDAGEVALCFGQHNFALHQMHEAAVTRMRRHYIGYVYQFFNLVPTLTVLENVRLPARLNKAKELDQLAVDLLCDFGLGARLDVFPHVLSGGEQQRVAVARALLAKPPLILADEPTGNLDVDNTARVAQLLFGTAKEMGLSVIVATHSEEIAGRADQHLRLGGPSV